MGRVAPSAWADPHALPVHQNVTINSAGSMVLPGYGMKEVTVVVNVTGTATGTSPTLTYTLEEVDPGDQATVFGSSASTTALTGTGITDAVLRVSVSGFIKVSWALTGITPSFSGVFATLTAKATTVISALDENGEETSIASDSEGKLRQSLQGYSGSYPQPTSYPNELSEAGVDRFGNLMTRGPVLTDEQSFRDDFVGTSLTSALTGTVNWTNSSTAVTGTGTLFTTEVKIGQYIKKTADASTFFVQVFSIESDTALTLVSVYTGSTAGAASVVSNWADSVGSGGSINVGSSLIALTTGTTNGSTTYIFRHVDYGPFTFLSQISLSQRIANQEFRAGFSDTASTTPGTAAFFRFTGTSNTSVDCVSQSSSAVADQQVTTVSLPEGLTSATQSQYRIDISGNMVTFIVAEDVVARHQLHIPGPYTVMGVILLSTNTGVPASSTNYTTDVVSVQNFDLLQTTATYIGEPLPVISVDTVGNGTLNALNAAATVQLSGQSGAAVQLAAGTLIGTIVPEISISGSAWVQTLFYDTTTQSYLPSITFAAANTSTGRTIVTPSGAGFARVRVSAFTSGTASAIVRASQVQASAILSSPVDGAKYTYSATINALAVPALATDVFTITGSATKTIRVTRVVVSGSKTTASPVLFVLLKRTANTGGTSTTRTAVPHDSSDVAASAVVRAYTANPTTGTLVGNIETVAVFIPTATLATYFRSYEWTFGGRPGAQAIVLRGINEVFSVNLNGVTVTGGSLNIQIEWTEEG